MNPDFINPLVLAYLGDSVLELLVRDYLVKESELKKVNELCQEATHFVSSLSHEKFILHLLETDFLTEEEVGIFKREIQKLLKEILKNIVIQQDLNV